MSDTEERRVRLSEVPLIADERWLNEMNTAAENGTAEVDSWLPVNLAEIPDEPPVQPTLGGLQLCYPGKRHVFSGPQESAKTLAAYVIGLSVVRTGQTVVLIDFEMGPWDAKTRLRELGATDEDLASVAYVAPETPATQVSVLQLVALSPGLVLIDAAAGAYDLQGLDDNKRGDVERFTRLYVTGFWKAGIATIVLDHVTKNVEGRGKYAIGSERKVGGADVHLGFEVVTPIKRGGHGLYKIVTHKDRGGFLKRGRLADFVLSSDETTHAIGWEFRAAVETPEGAEWRPTVKMEQVSRWLERHPEPVPMSHIEEGVGGNRDVAREAIQVLIDEGWIEESAGPRKARLMEVVKVYREEYDDLSPTSPDLSQNEHLHDLSSSPHPLRGGEVRGGVEKGRERSSQGEVEDDDGIPF